MQLRFFTKYFVFVAIVIGTLGATAKFAQTYTSASDSTLARYLDQSNGMSADDAVRIALEKNGELNAMRSEVKLAQALVKQAGLRANPSVEANGTKQIGGTDNDLMVQGMVPLELGGRRTARIRIAEREVALREKALAERERLLAAEVRRKFGDALAQTLKLKLAEDLLDSTVKGFELVKARVEEGRTAPLEENMTLVETNRLRSIRETEEGKTRIAFLELRSLLGMTPEEPLRIRGGFDNLVAPVPALADAIATALQNRPDLAGMRAMEELAEAQIEQARAEGRPDASVTAGYQRMNFSFPLKGLTDTGQLRPIQDIFHYFTFGVKVDLPVWNRNQGAVEAAAANREAARQRREFAEIVVRREVAASIALYESAAKASEIYRVGVLEQARANLDVVRQTYELGSKTLLDYIAEQRRFIDIENAFIDAERETYDAKVEILKAMAAPELTVK